jgi:hypothetical protein
MLYQPSNITPDELNGTGTVDVTQDVAVSWEVNGNSAMTAYEIAFYQNNAASTAVWTTGKVVLGTPFWGVSYDGTQEAFSVTLSGLSGHGLSNGNEYKMLITQWWDTNDSVTQFTASLILTRDNPVLTMTAIPSPLEDKEYSFTALYTQTQGDSIKWVRWQIAYQDDKNNPFVDTGYIYGTGELQVDYDGFLTDTSYSVICTIETQNGVQATTDWVDFNVSYTLETATEEASACQLADSSSVWINWDQVESADGYSIMRQTIGENRLIKIADVSATTGQIRDYSARSGQSYKYYVFPEGNLAFLTEPLQTETVKVQYWYWAIVEAEPVAGEKDTYSAIAAYYFKYGAGGVAEGQFSNNNNPQISQNFTRYPTRQGTTANYKTGTLSGFIGTISHPSLEYKDTVAQSEALFALSNTENALFLIDPKGHFLRIHTAAATTLQIDHKSRVMPQTVTISWVEVGSTDGIHLIMYPGGDFYPVDRVILTELSLNLSTGALTWTVPDDYSGTGSVLSINADGALIQTASGSYRVADMTLDPTTGILSAEITGV